MPRHYTPGPMPFVPFLSVELTCVQCNVRFLVPRKRGSQRFCLSACAYEARRKPKVPLVCPICRVTFEVLPCDASLRRYCSPACLSASQRRRHRIVCQHCGTVTERPVSHQAIFCGNACRLAARRVVPSGTEIMADGTARLPLFRRNGTVSGYARIDAADAGWASQWRWHLSRTGYVCRGDQHADRPRMIRLHRVLLGLVHGDGQHVDHIDRDRLNCTRANLRIVTQAANNQNVSRSLTRGGPRYRGVFWCADTNRWRVRVGRVHVGRFDDEEEAAEAARAARRRLLPYATD